jgi:diaminopimelate epimerase
MKFEKWQALGNDYMILESAELPFALTAARVRALCRAHFGIGADGVLLLSLGTAAGDAIASLRIFNPDGSEAELSGNGAREAILYLHRRGFTGAERFTIQTAAGPIEPTILSEDRCRVEMGRAALVSDDFPGGPPDGLGELSVDGHTWRFRHVWVGNPQCAIAVADEATLEALDLGRLGPPIEAHAAFPKRTNVSWYAPLAPADGARVRARIFERGVGETLSSGTGASGAAIAHLLSQANDPGADTATGTVEVVLDGGELEVELGENLHMTLTGWARPVFAGTLSDDLLKELHETE